MHFGDFVTDSQRGTFNKIFLTVFLYIFVNKIKAYVNMFFEIKYVSHCRVFDSHAGST